MDLCSNWLYASGQCGASRPDSHGYLCDSPVGNLPGLRLIQFLRCGPADGQGRYFAATLAFLLPDFLRRTLLRGPLLLPDAVSDNAIYRNPTPANNLATGAIGRLGRGGYPRSAGLDIPYLRGYGLAAAAKPLHCKIFDSFIRLCSLILLPYLLSNWIFFGGLMPVSGWMKSSFPLLNPRGYEPPLTLLGSSIPFGILPLIAGLAALINSRISHENKKMLGIYLFGAFCQFLYVGLFTRSHTFWRWYYVVPMILLALSTSLFASTFGNKCRPVVYAVIILCLGGLISGSFLKFSRDESPENKALKIIRYLADNQIHHQTILVSDFPGQVASQDMSNRIIAADMLTGNRRLYQEMKDSGNALEYLLRLCRNKGKPIAYIIYVGNYFLVPDGRGEKIVYNDPKRYPDQIPWGSLNVPSGPLYSEPGFMVWKPDLP